MKNIKLYTWRTCPFCIRAKELLTKNGYEFEEEDILDFPEKKAELTRQHGQHTVPYVFIEDQLIGGCSDLENLINKGEFDALVN